MSLVLRASNVPHLKTTFGEAREYYVTIAYQAATEKVKKKKTKGVEVEGQTVVWNETLDALSVPFFFSVSFIQLKVPFSSVQPSSRLKLCLYAKKRWPQKDLLIGTHEISIPESKSGPSVHDKSLSIRLTQRLLHVDISFLLGNGNGQTRQSTQPVTLYLTIIVSANRISPGLPPSIPTEGDNTLAEEVTQPTIAPDSGGPDQSTEPEHTLPPTSQLPVQSSTPVPQDQGEMAPVEQVQISLDLAEKAKKSIGTSNTWGGVVGRIKWLMDTLAPIAGVRVIFVCLPSLSRPPVLSSIRWHRWRIV